MSTNTEEKKIWGIHTQNDNLFLNKDLIAIGWRDFGDLTKVEASRDAFKAHYVEAYPEAKKRQIENGAGMLYRFLHEVQIGDHVVFPSKTERRSILAQLKAITSLRITMESMYSVEK